MIDDVRNAYTPGDFWSKVAKSVCRRFLLFRPRMDWRHTIEEFLKEYTNTQKTHGHILEATMERVEDFLARLTCRLWRMGDLTEAEEIALLAALRNEAPIPDVHSDRAKSLILKACLEFGRLRQRPPMSLSLKDIVENVWTIDELVEWTIDAPLSKRKTLNLLSISSTEFAHVLTRARSTPEYHLAVGSYCADTDYVRAIEEISRAYDSLDNAFHEILKKTRRSEHEVQFVRKYKRMAEMIL